MTYRGVIRVGGHPAWFTKDYGTHEEAYAAALRLLVFLYQRLSARALGLAATQCVEVW